MKINVCPAEHGFQLIDGEIRSSTTRNYTLETTCGAITRNQLHYREIAPAPQTLAEKAYHRQMRDVEIKAFRNFKSNVERIWQQWLQQIVSHSLAMQAKKLDTLFRLAMPEEYEIRILGTIEWLHRNDESKLRSFIDGRGKRDIDKAKLTDALLAHCWLSTIYSSHWASCSTYLWLSLSRYRTSVWHTFSKQERKEKRENLHQEF